MSSKLPYHRALVTGGAGFIGHHLVRALLGEGLEVTIVDDLSVGTRDRAPDGARLVVGDVRDRALLADVMRGIDIVFHQAARVSIRDSVRCFVDDCDINVMGTVHTLQAAGEAGVKKFVYASSMGVYGPRTDRSTSDEDTYLDPLSPYGIGKLAGERYRLLLAKALGFDSIALRYFNTFGPGQTYTPYVGVITIFINKLLAGESPTIFGDGEQTRDFVHISDIVQANLLAMHSDVGSAVFNVGTGVGTSVNDLLALLGRKLGVTPTPTFVPARKTELQYSVANIAKATATLAYRPQATIEDRIDEVIDSIRG